MKLYNFQNGLHFPYQDIRIYRKFKIRSIYQNKWPIINSKPDKTHTSLTLSKLKAYFVIGQ